VDVSFLVEATKDVELRRILFDAHLVVAEEKAVVWASKLLGNPLPDNVIVPNLLPQLLAPPSGRRRRRVNRCIPSTAFTPPKTAAWRCAGPTRASCRLGLRRNWRFCRRMPPMRRRACG
jgi:hypothetical protein